MKRKDKDKFKDKDQHMHKAKDNGDGKDNEHSSGVFLTRSPSANMDPLGEVCRGVCELRRPIIN